MITLQEVPGAGERPGGSRVRIERADEGRETVLTIPARSPSFVVGMGAVVLAVNLLAVLWMGMELFFWGHSVGVMAQIAPNSLPLPLLHWSLPLLLGWVALEGLGAAALLVLVQPGFVQERIVFAQDGVEWRQQGGGRHRTLSVSRTDGPYFQLKRDPQRLTASVLTLCGGSHKIPVAEHVTEAEREWLCSVGNALLREAF